MHILSLLGYIFLLAISGVLLFALLRAQRTTRDLAEQLALAREQHHQHTLQLTQRSELDTLKDEFISTVSHELRTPLTSIRGALGLLSSGIIGDVDAKALNLPPMAEANTVHLVLEPFTVAQAAYPEALFFDGDADRILQVVTNLLSNAIKFSPIASTVRVHTEATSDSILLKVVDEGRGIPTDKLDSIFDRFQQIEPSDARQKGGTGLGLAICRSIVQQHSGSIWAQRNLGLGS